jgi:hypothetical protein
MIRPTLSWATVPVYVLFAACTAATPTPQAAKQEATHALIGAWVGTYENLYRQGALHFTVTRVTDDRVEGIAHIVGGLPYHGFDWPFTGTLKGNQLTGTIPTSPRGPTVSWDLTLSSDGRMLSGQGLSTYWAATYSKLSLTKQQ